MTLDDLNSKIGGKYPITSAQFEFINRYLEHGNGMRAVREAGFKHSTAGSQSSAAYRLLKQPKIKQAIAAMQEVRG